MPSGDTATCWEPSIAQVNAYRPKSRKIGASRSARMPSRKSLTSANAEMDPYTTPNKMNGLDEDLSVRFMVARLHSWTRRSHPRGRLPKLHHGAIQLATRQQPRRRSPGDLRAKRCMDAP